MNVYKPISFILAAFIALGSAQLVANDASPVLLADGNTSASSIPQLNLPIPRARMSWELALDTYEQNSLRQARELGDYTDETTIEAELPQSAQKGRFRLKRMFSAPKSLAFKTIDFVGDNFVKTNVIARLLQSEVDHVQKGDNSDTAITSANYKFSYKGEDVIDGQSVHAFQIKPRKKRIGLFKGKVYLDVYTGRLLRAEGRVVKSPSFFVKKIDFVQDYSQVGDFNLVSRIHSVAQARIIGRTIVDITHSDFQLKPLAQHQASTESRPRTSASLDTQGYR
ncbi:MAG TPA: hypothetical protein VN577_21485 [Terriglobales bacterium]|nr:hypothetical protein [Terriglobales bacterium]